MKQTPEWDQIQENMRPGIISRDGFLGQDVRKLIDIVEEDHRTVTSQGFSHEALAGQMEYVTLLGRVGFGNPVKVDDIFEVTVEDSRGVIPCPFGHKGVYPKENIRVINLQTGEELRWTAMNIHLIREHGFYEGKGSPFRVPPEDIIRILALKERLSG